MRARWSVRLTTIKAGMTWLGNYLVRTNQENLTMTSDMIEIWAGILGLAYLAAAGLYFEMLSAGKHGHGPARYGFGRHIRPCPVEIRNPR